MIGRTKFCIHPDDRVKAIPVIGGTKNPRIASLSKLEPDLVIANKEENREEDISMIREFCPVWTSDIPNFEKACQAILAIGSMCDRKPRAEQIINELQHVLDRKPFKKVRKVAYLIWREPLMTIGGDTYIQDMLSRFGLQNIFSDLMRYPQITADEINQRKPDLILLSSEPYPFRNKHVAEMRRACPGSKVQLVNGEIFSWYGSRLLHITEKELEYVRSLAD